MPLSNKNIANLLFWIPDLISGNSQVWWIKYRYHLFFQMRCNYNMMSLMLLCGSGGQPQTVLYTLVTVGIQGPQMKNSNFRESPLAHLTKGSIKFSSHQVAFRYRRLWFDLWVGNIPCGRKWQPTPVFLPGKFHGQRSLADYSPWGCKESDMTEQLNRNTHTQTCTHAGMRAHPQRPWLPADRS